MTKEDFRQYRAIDAELKQIEKELDRLRWMRDHPQTARWSYSRDGQGEPGFDDIMAEIVVKLTDLERMHAEKWDELLEKQREVEGAINALEDSEQRQLMRYRYIDGLGWDGVCQRMYISRDTVHRLHRAVLKQQL